MIGVGSAAEVLKPGVQLVGNRSGSTRHRWYLCYPHRC